MARFRLRGPHYLKVPNTEWEQAETDQVSGKTARKTYSVPLYLDPRNEGDCNYPGEIIVSTKEDRAFPKDILFLGDPTPDMEPIDADADALVERVKHKWVHPIETLPTQGEAPVARRA